MIAPQTIHPLVLSYPAICECQGLIIPIATISSHLPKPPFPSLPSPSLSSHLTMVAVQPFDSDFFLCFHDFGQASPSKQSLRTTMRPCPNEHYVVFPLVVTSSAKPAIPAHSVNSPTAYHALFPSPAVQSAAVAVSSMVPSHISPTMTPAEKAD
jgi:hypothetical protein